MILAALDIGTNSTRLLLADDSGKQICRLTKVTGLGKGMVQGKNIHLQKDAMDRTLACLKEYKKVMDEHSPSQTRAVSTSAARDADNTQDFLDMAEQIIGERPVVLNAGKEAELAYIGTVGGLKTSATDDQKKMEFPVLTIDIGGGSTEFAFGENETCKWGVSFDLGCVRLYEEMFSADPPAAEELSACLSLVETYLQELISEHPETAQARTLLAMAGTATSAAAIDLGRYDPEAVHHFVLKRAAAEDVFRTLATETVEQRKENPGLSPDRADVIVAGMCVLIKTIRFFDFEQCLISETDLLDGIIQEMRTDMPKSSQNS